MNVYRLIVDLFDCYFEIIEPTNEYLFHVMDQIQDPIRNREKFNQNDGEFKKSFKLHFKAAMFRFYGILSMTTCNKNILMWAHYSNNEGFAVEFDYTKFPFDFDGPFYINYKSDFEKLILKTDSDKRLATNYMCNIKDEKWKYENEWRIIVKATEKQQLFSPKIQIYKELGGHNRNFNYPLNAIKSISLANHFFEIDETIQRNNQILDISLNERTEKKVVILDFLYQHNIKTKIITRETMKGNTFELDFREGYLTKTAANNYTFNAID